MFEGIRLWIDLFQLPDPTSYRRADLVSGQIVEERARGGPVIGLSPAQAVRWDESMSWHGGIVVAMVRQKGGCADGLSVSVNLTPTGEMALNSGSRAGFGRY